MTKVKYSEIEQLAAAIDEMHDADKLNVHNAYCYAAGDLGSIIYRMETFEMLPYSKWQVMDMCSRGDCDGRHAYYTVMSVDDDPAASYVSTADDADKLMHLPEKIAEYILTTGSDLSQPQIRQLLDS